MKQKHTKYTQINTNKSTHSEMGPCDNIQSRELQEMLIKVCLWLHSFSTQCNTEQLW